ncbi:MAG: FecR domain-containing protein [Kordiimonadaceae bacterium]|nr:FecR domain-containing protein [Kordiimonadaceae bacterium]
MADNKTKQMISVDDVARDWFARLYVEDPTVEDIALWQQWINEAEENAAAYQRVSSVWEASERLLVDSVQSISFEFSERKTSSSSDDYTGKESVSDYLSSKAGREAHAKPAASIYHIFARKWPVELKSVAASIAVMVISIGVWFSVAQPQENVTDTRIETAINTGAIEHQSARLSDGSQVDVGASSALQVQFGEKRRNITLAHGEAFFEVAPDAARPFTVITPLGDVVAIGTAFNVKLNDDRIIVTVTEGKVGLNLKQNPDLVVSDIADERSFQEFASYIVAGQEAVFTEEAGLAVAVAAPEAQSVPWREKRLVYRTEQMKYVLADLARYSDYNFTVSGSRVAGLLYSGTVRTDRIEDWLNALPQVFPVEVQILENHVSIHFAEKPEE